MSALKIFTPAIALAALSLGTAVPMSAPQAAPLANAGNQIEAGSAANLQRVRHGWGGVGIYIGPSYGGYYDDDYYYYRPRRSYYYSDDYDRPYRRHSYRWTQERFKHPLGRR